MTSKTLLLACPPLFSITNGLLFPDTVLDSPSLVGTIATYQCEDDFIFETRDNTIVLTCTQTFQGGTWLPSSVPPCLPSKRDLLEPLYFFNRSSQFLLLFQMRDS